MEEVAEPADQARRGGRVVVGAEQAGEARVGVEPGHGAGDGVGDGRRRRRRGRRSAGRSRPSAPRFRAEAGPSLTGLRINRAPNDFGQPGGAVGRAVVDDDQLVIGPGGVSKPSEAALEVATPIVHGDHHRERRPPGPRARRTGGEIVHEPPSPVKTRVPECVPILGVARTRASTSSTSGRVCDFQVSFGRFAAPSPEVATCGGTLAGTIGAVNAGRTGIRPLRIP